MENRLSSLERIVEYDLIVVLKHLTMNDKMSLRVSSTTLLRWIDEIENTFNIWSMDGADSTRLKRLVDEICTVQGKTFKREYALQIFYLNFINRILKSVSLKIVVKIVGLVKATKFFLS